jgi:hypothetical protein
MPGLDKLGETGRDYEDYVKSVVNPVDSTPRYWGFQLTDPRSGGLVYYDDCQHETGMMVEAKGPGYANLLSYGWGRDSVAADWLTQSASQLAAAGTRSVRWYFAEPQASGICRRTFSNIWAREDRNQITALVEKSIAKKLDKSFNELLPS